MHFYKGDKGGSLSSQIEGKQTKALGTLQTTFAK